MVPLVSNNDEKTQESLIPYRSRIFEPLGPKVVDGRGWRGRRFRKCRKS